jgi:hypothetical protein
VVVEPGSILRKILRMVKGDDFWFKKSPLGAESEQGNAQPDQEATSEGDLGEGEGEEERPPRGDGFP